MISLAAAAPLEVSLTVADVEVVAGRTLDVRVHIAAARPVLVRGATVELATRLTYLHKEGGFYGGYTIRARRTEVRAGREVPGPWPIEAGEVVHLPVTLRVPASAPGTTRVPLVELTWWVQVQVRVADFPDTRHKRSFVVLTGAAGLAEQATGPGVCVDRRSAQVAIEELSSRSLTPGRPVSGTVVVTPLRALPVRSARVVLVVRQQIHHGEWTTEDPTRNPANQGLERDLVVAQQLLGGPRTFAPGTPVRMPFTLLLPEDLPTASEDNPNYTLTWLLRAVLDRRLRPDPYAELPMHARTIHA